MPSEADQRFRAADRLSKAADYASILADRRGVRGRHFQVLYRPNVHTWARLGIISGKRYARRAVDRNLVRRLARESFRIVKSRLAGQDIVIRLLAPVTRAERRELHAELAGLLGKLAR